MKKIVTFTTDWHDSDYYAGAVKAAVISQAGEANFVDVTHNIEHYNIFQAAFILKRVIKNFPSGTIHIIGVDSEPDSDGKVLVAKYLSQYFISRKNFCQGIIFESKPEIVIEIDVGYGLEGYTFPELSIFSIISAFILKGGDLKELGEQIDDVPRSAELKPEIGKGFINGYVIFNDSYGNAITNISYEDFANYVGEKKFEISFSSIKHKINVISTSYREEERGSALCLFNSMGLLEIAVREGKASLLLGLKKKSEVRIKF
ncbi:MAG: SAM-dependent chlorinase/fluorinase [Bacteroidales bacterium]